MIHSKIALFPNMNQGQVDKWFNFLKAQGFAKEKSKEMTLRDLAAKMSIGVGNGKR